MTLLSKLKKKILTSAHDDEQRKEKGYFESGVYQNGLAVSGRVKGGARNLDSFVVSPMWERRCRFRHCLPRGLLCASALSITLLLSSLSLSISISRRINETMMGKFLTSTHFLA